MFAIPAQICLELVWVCELCVALCPRADLRDYSYLC